MVLGGPVSFSAIISGRMTSALEALLQHGALGIVSALAVGYSWILHKRLSHVQDRRVEDARAVTEVMLSLNDKWSEVIREHTRAVEALQHTVELLRSTMGRNGRP